MRGSSKRITVATLVSVMVLSAIILIWGSIGKSDQSQNFQNAVSTFNGEENPSFSLKIASPKEDIENNISFYTSIGQKTNIDVDIQKEEGGNTKVTLERPNSFVPGKYKMVINDNGRSIEQDFLWGVLAINPNKAVYSPFEDAKLDLAVLDEIGMMVCDASLRLIITSPQGRKSELSTQNGLIRLNPECRIKDLVLKPDYETNYKVQNAGIYKMDLTSVTKNGVYSISDFFQVKDSVPFSIERSTATRIYPIRIYPVLLRIKANQDFTGTITERVPKNFEITPSERYKSYQRQEIVNEEKLLHWSVSLKRGDEIEIGYNYDAPDTSPQFYLLGALGFQSSTNQEVYTEERQWQIASDTPPTISGTNTSSEGSSVTTHTVALPASVAAGDLVVAIVAADSGATSFTWPGSWNEIKDSAGTGFVTTVAYLIASGGETSVNVTSSSGERSNHISFRVAAANWHGTTPPEISTGATGSSDSPNPDTLTPSWGAEDTLWVALASADDSAFTAEPAPISAWPTNYTDNQVQNHTVDSAAVIAMASRGLNATSEDPGVFTMTLSETWAGFTLGVRPSAAPTDTPTPTPTNTPTPTPTNTPTPTPSGPGTLQFEGVQMEGVQINYNIYEEPAKSISITSPNLISLHKGNC